MTEEEKKLERRVSRIEWELSEIVRPQMKKSADFLEDNKGGITTATLLNNKIIATLVIAILGAGILVLNKGGLW